MVPQGQNETRIPPAVRSPSSTYRVQAVGMAKTLRGLYAFGMSVGFLPEDEELIQALVRIELCFSALLDLS
jgi:hypothetical protein